MDTKTLLPLDFLLRLSCPQGMYYCSVGGKHTRKRVEEHADLCIAAINFEGINQEGLWTMGISIVCTRSKKKQDEIWVARYLLDRLTEKYGYYIEYHPNLGDTD
jgi:glutamine synthetase